MRGKAYRADYGAELSTRGRDSVRCGARGRWKDFGGYDVAAAAGTKGVARRHCAEEEDRKGAQLLRCEASATTQLEKGQQTEAADHTDEPGVEPSLAAQRGHLTRC